MVSVAYFMLICSNFFDIASAVATASKCKRLDKIDFKAMENFSLQEIRKEIGLEEKFLLNAYTLEQDMFPNELDAKRLLLWVI